MKFFQFLLFIGLLVFVSCGKDKFTTIPQVTIHAISPGTVQSGDIVILKGKYTDQEGDIDSVLIVRKYYDGATATRSDTLERIDFALTGVPKNTSQADIQLTFEYNTFNTPYRSLSGVQKDTTATLGLLLIDKEANRSEFKESDKIRLLKP